MTLVISNSPFLPFPSIRPFSLPIISLDVNRILQHSRIRDLYNSGCMHAGPTTDILYTYRTRFFTHVHVFSFSISTLSAASAHSPSLLFSLGSDLIQHECPFFAFTCLMLGTPRNCSFSLVLTALQFIVDIITQSVQPHHSFIIPPLSTDGLCCAFISSFIGRSRANHPILTRRYRPHISSY